MKITWLAIGGVRSSVTAFQMIASEPEWNPSRVKDCDRECLVGFMDGSKVEPTQSGFTSPIP